MKKKIASKNDGHDLVTKGWLSGEFADGFKKDLKKELKEEILSETNPRFDDLQARFDRFSDIVVDELRTSREDRRRFELERQELYSNDVRQELGIDALEQRVFKLETAP